MISIIRSCLALFLLVLLSGCFEETQRIVLNPDGSGKTRIEIVRAASIPMQGEDFDAQTVLKETAQAIIEKSKGIDAWKDVSFGYHDDGRMYFRGTAYFPALDALKIDSQAGKNSSGGSGFSTNLSLRSTGKGIELFAKPANDKEEDEPQDKVLDPFKEKIKYQQLRGTLVAFFTGLRSECYIELPAVPVECSGFQLNGETLHYLFVGEKALAVIDRVVTDDAFWRQLAAEGKGADDVGDWAQKEIFGGDLYARLPGKVANRFDYTGEMVKAAKTWPEERERLFVPSLLTASGEQVPAIDKVKPGATVAAEGIRIASLTMNFLDRQTNKDLPLFAERGWKATIVTALPAALTDVSSGVVSRAVAEDGSDLLPENDWDRRIHFPKLSDDGRFVVAELPEFTLPAGFSGTLRELSGEFTGMVSDGEKVIDLGLIETQKGSKGKELEATVTEVGPSKWSPGKYGLSLKLQINSHFVKGFTIVDEKGTPVEFEPGSTQMGDSLTETFQLGRPWPAKVRIKVTIHDNIVEHKIPFKLENVNLLASGDAEAGSLKNQAK